jgi:hypothetical protein
MEKQSEYLCDKIVKPRSSHIHRRVSATKKALISNGLDIVRLPSKAIYDVDTVDGSENLIVSSGRNKVGEYGGLSIQTDINIHGINSPDGFRIFDSNSNEPVYERKPGMPRLWHCYKCLPNVLDTAYGIDYDDYPVQGHAQIYPINDMEIFDFHYHRDTNNPLGRLPKIRSMPWEFCCNLVEIGKPQKDMRNFNDSGFTTIINCLLALRDYTDFSDEADICDGIIKWIHNTNDLDKVEDIFQLMSDKMYSNLLSFLRDFHEYTDFDDEIYDCCQIEQRLQSFAHTSTHKV